MKIEILDTVENTVEDFEVNKDGSVKSLGAVTMKFVMGQKLTVGVGKDISQTRANDLLNDGFAKQLT